MSDRENFPFFLSFRFIVIASLATLIGAIQACGAKQAISPNIEVRERILINEDWTFYKYESIDETDHLIYDVRPQVVDDEDGKQADAQPTEAVEVKADQEVLKPWIMPSGNAFIKDPTNRYQRPEGSPGADFAFVQSDFDDGSWESVDLPHDWAIKGPFFEGSDAAVEGGMGRLPSPGVGWYRKDLDIPASDAGRTVFLDIDGAMSYAIVWLNGHLVGGWPYGYNSFRLDLTPYIQPGEENQLAIRLDNPPNSSRWYPGGGIYRNVWLVKTNPVHVGQWGTYVTTSQVSEKAATVNIQVTVDNDLDEVARVEIVTDIYELDADGTITGKVVASLPPKTVQVEAGASEVAAGSVTINDPKLWGPLPNQEPNRYVAVTTIKHGGKAVDQYDTPFGIRTLRFDGQEGVFVNGERIHIKGANQHHDLGALGAAFNVRAAERQLEILREAGVNAIRMAHNPPAPELLELTDRMGFLVVDEIFDVWERKKTPLDFHLIFPEWHEQDLRAFIRRDRNHPSIFLWSFGNEVGEQYTEEEGAKLAQYLQNIIKEEDTTRLTTASMNYAKPPMPFPEVMEVINLNYQGEGIRNAPAYAHLRNRGITTPPLYPSFHEAFPDKVIISSENAAAVSTRGTYIFPVFNGVSAPVSDSTGGDPENAYVSAYELYTVQFGSSAEKVFRSESQHPYVAGGFVWSGWDYLGEPTPYYQSRSSYFGIVDLAGFKKDRFYLYQSYWRPDYPMAHILPHWNWPGRVGEITPVHVFTSGDEAELFLNGNSLGRKKKGEYEYRLRWDDVIYEPGEVKVVAYKKGKKWAEDVVKTTGAPVGLVAEADRSQIHADGDDLSFITVKVVDEHGVVVPDANNKLQFTVEGPGEIVATDNGDPTSMVPFPSKEREAFNGLALVIIQGIQGEAGIIKLKAEADSLEGAEVLVSATNDL